MSSSCKSYSHFFSKNWLCWGFTTCQPLLVILCHLQEKERREIEEIVEEMKEMDRGERGKWMKVKKQKKRKHSPYTLTCCKDSRPCLNVSRFSKHINIYAIFNDQSFNNTLTNDIVSFEQVGPGMQKQLILYIFTYFYISIFEQI